MQNTIAFTRKQYMNKEVTHQEYYSQFVTPGVLRLVEGHIGRKRILESSDPHFNDIPLREWDDLQGQIIYMVGRLIQAANGTNCISLSDTVCVAKAAAEKLRNEKQT